QLALNLGGDSFVFQAASLIRASVSRENPYLSTMAAVTRLEVVAVAVAALAVAASVVGAITRLSRWSSLDARDRTLVWLVTMVAGMASATSAAHVVGGVTYPQGRMALYWIPFVTLTAAVAWSRTNQAGAPRLAGWSIALIALTIDLSLFDATTYADWIPD